MPRPRRADEAAGLYQALNRGHGQYQIFWKVDEDSAFERILVVALDSKSRAEPAVLSSWPISRPRGWIERVNQPLTKKELAAVRDSAKRGCPFGDIEWVESTVKRFGLQSTWRLRGRPRVRNSPSLDIN